MRVFRFAIDRGGTFTDVYAEMDVLDAAGRVVEVKPLVIKLLSEDPDNYPDAPREGIRRVLEQMTGTTVATNALLERQGERTALVTTKGFKDLLYIGNQSRPKIFDLEIRTPDMLYESVVEVEERLQVISSENEVLPSDVKGISGDYIRVLKQLDVENLREQLKVVYQSGIRSVAIVLLHAYTFPKHEQDVAKIAQELGFTQISLSSEVMPMIKAGCMNNLTFGSSELGGYYETIAGGAGAEILEKRYPVLLRAFHLRDGSGGQGHYRGGDGVIREIEFLQPMTVSILSERRAFRPYGLAGGEDGARGLNLLTRKGGRVINLGGKNTVDVFPNEVLTIHTPGGGGYGTVPSN
ncbi:hypothetical protein ATCC90586_008319 [Pythium insidiosum]|nr:hypothetical protein ATCC90586_008319 [Pythium insidiosum]